MKCKMPSKNSEIQIFLSLFILLFTSSCSKKLEDNTHDACWGTYGHMPAQLYYIETTEGDVCFQRPIYDNGILISAYINFFGHDANHYYKYSEDSIVMLVSSREGYTIEYTYYMHNGIIHKCKSHDSRAGTSIDGLYDDTQVLFQHDNQGRLTLIKKYVDESRFISEYEWNSIDNIIAIHDTLFFKNDKGEEQMSYANHYSYKYESYKGYKPLFPLIHISPMSAPNYIFALDPILIAEGYFGKVIPNQLPVEQKSKFSTEYLSYTIDRDGKIIEAHNESRNYSSYILTW